MGKRTSLTKRSFSARTRSEREKMSSETSDLGCSEGIIKMKRKLMIQEGEKTRRVSVACGEDRPRADGGQLRTAQGTRRRPDTHDV
jgi:hypothetical protein